MNLFDFLKGRDWRDDWLETATERQPLWYKLDSRTDQEFRELANKASGKGNLKLALQIEELRKVRKTQQWID